MIITLTGAATYKGAGYVIISAGPVGYKVFTTAATYQSLVLDKPITLWTHLAVREDSHSLYGFETQEELSFFELLLTVSGIGPKSALAILSMENVDTLRSAVIHNDSTYLTKVSGIGRKNAEKIILELRDKLGAKEGDTSHMHEHAEVLDALATLGYSAREAREALKQVPPEIVETSEKLKAILKILGSRT
jgi:Holliday junction DNA helicase RuvA